MLCLVAQSCPTLCYPMYYWLSGSSVHGYSPARILEWVTMLSSRASSQPRDQTQVYLQCGQILYQLSHQGSPLINESFHNIISLIQCFLFLTFTVHFVAAPRSVLFFQNVLWAFYESSALPIRYTWVSSEIRTELSGRVSTPDTPFIGMNHSRAKFWGRERRTPWPLCEQWRPWFRQASWPPSSQTVAKVAVSLVDWLCGILVGSPPGPG